MAHRAVFLDRDQTLIHDPGYLADPAAVRLLPGVGAGLRRMAAAGYKLVVVTNQAAIARGLLTEAGLAEIHARLRALLRAEGVELDAIYYCPYHPEGTVAPYNAEHPERKPSPGMLLRAARELDLDLAQSWMVGDAPRDVEAGRRAGCRTILVAQRSSEPAPDEPQPDFVADTFEAAAAHVLR